MYHVFAGAGWYPSSGLGDYIDSYTTSVEALEVARKHVEYNPEYPFSGDDWYAVITEDENGKLILVESGWKQEPVEKGGSV